MINVFAERIKMKFWVSVFVFLMMFTSVDAIAADGEAKDADPLWLTINGQKVMQSELDKDLAMQFESMAKSGQAPDDNAKNMYRVQVAEGKVTEVLVEQQIKAKKIKVADSEVTAKLEELAKDNEVTVEKLMEMAKTQGGLDADELKRRIKMGVSFERLMEAELKAKGESVSASDEDIKKYYDENSKLYNKPVLFKTSHILAGGRGLTEEKKAEAKTKIADVKKKLDAGGNFEELAKEFSDCPSSAKGGDLEVYIDKDGNIDGTRPGMDKQYSAAAAELKVGGVSDIVETQFGYHIIKVTDKKEAENKKLEDVKEEIVEILEGRKKQEFSKKYIEDLTNNSKVEWSEVAEAAKKALEEERKKQQQMMIQRLMQQQMQQQGGEKAGEAKAEETPKK